MNFNKTSIFTNTRGREIQCNIDKDFVFKNKKNDSQEDLLYNIRAGEDGVIFLNEERLASATDDSGWLIQIEDAYMPDTDTVVIVSSDGVIALYENSLKNKDKNIIANDWKYKILLENSECYYDILEAIISKKVNSIKKEKVLSLKVITEFSGEIILDFTL